MAEEDNSALNFSLIIAVVLSVVLATSLSYFMMMKFGGLTNGEQKGEPKQQEEVKKLGATHSLNQFLVNLSESNSYVKLSISVEVSNKDVINEIKNRNPQIRDTVISILRSKKMEDISDNPSARKLREEIRKNINQNLAKGKVTNVFFTEFVVQ